MNTHSKHIMIVVFSALTTLLLFQNCAPAEFSKEQTPASTALSTPTTPVMLPPTPTIDQALTACDQLNDPRMHTDDVPVFFDNPLNEVGAAPVCAWNQNGNVATNNGYLTARYTQAKSISIPTGAILCAVDFQFATQAMKYDDNFFFLANDMILATNDDYWQKNHLTSQPLSIGSGRTVNVSRFDWSALVGKPNWVHAGAAADGVDYCIGASQGLSSCSWPVTEIAGSISMSIAPQILTALSLANGRNGLDVKFITTGDDNPTTDCQHEPLSMHLKVRYIVP